MSVYISDPDLTIHVGDVLDILPTLEDESVDCVATSPPFYGLRDYGTGTWEGGGATCDHKAAAGKDRAFTNGRGEGVADDYAGSNLRSWSTRDGTTYGQVCGKCGARRVDRQIGLEATPDEWVAELVAVFRECRRILRPHGTLWIECGDSYGGGGPGGQSTSEDYTRRRGITGGHRGAAIKAKDLLGQPWLLAFALRADGWYLRQCIVWHKPNAMPESVRDRCTTAHSYVFLFSKQPRYWFDADAIAEPAAWERWGDQTVPKYEGTPTATGWMQPRSKHELIALGGRTTNGQKPRTDERRGFDNRLERADGMKNARSVWTIPTRGYPGAHFATWPETLAERIILAGCPETVCGTCGNPRERVVEKTRYKPDIVEPGVRFVDETRRDKTRKLSGADYNRTVKVLGESWTDCGHDNYRPGVVLDPFFGAGTTGLVARRLGRRCVGVELNEEYARMAAERCSQLSLLA